MTAVQAALCRCGCGRQTAVATKTSVSKGHVKGRPLAFIQSHNTRITRAGYVRHRVDGESAQEHVEVAARALGRRLPPGAEVHHVDEDRRNNAQRNLVICQDRGYHMLLHVRARVARAGGDPNSQRICSGCRQLKGFGAFSKCMSNKADGFGRTCRECQVAYRRTYVRPSKRAGVAA